VVKLLRKHNISGKFVQNQYWRANFELIFALGTIRGTKIDQDRDLFSCINASGIVGEEQKFPSSPATAKITKVGLKLHFGWAHAHPGIA
jgi:hypothetical protein